VAHCATGHVGDVGHLFEETAEDPPLQPFHPNIPCGANAVTGGVG